MIVTITPQNVICGPYLMKIDESPEYIAKPDRISLNGREYKQIEMINKNIGIPISLIRFSTTQ